MPVEYSSLSGFQRASYLVMLVYLVLVASLHLATPFITVLFSYLVLHTLCWRGKKWLAILLLLVICAGLFTGFGFFLKRASRELPEIVSTAIPRLVEYADAHKIELPFNDLAGLKGVAVENIQGLLGSLGNFAKVATKEFVFLIMGLMIAIGVFLNPSIAPEQASQEGLTDLYSQLAAAVSERFSSFYQSFQQVMYAQLTISAVNTTLTAIFVFGCSLKYASLVVVVTFLCGLLPIIGNIISNTIIIGIAFTMSPGLALWALLFLVGIHKLEYLLNSKIIGARIRHPMWLMLLALILGERLMGIPGLILAPVLLSFIKSEATRIEISPVSRNETTACG